MWALCLEGNDNRQRRDQGGFWGQQKGLNKNWAAGEKTTEKIKNETVLRITGVEKPGGMQP